MSNRRPAEPYYTGSPTGAAARSPAERLEPTRPPARPKKRYRLDREPGGSRPLVRLLNGILTLSLLMMVLIGGLAIMLDTHLDAPGPLERSKVVVIPKGDGTQEIAARLEREGMVGDRRLFIAGYLWAKFSAWLEGGKPIQLKAGDFEVRQAMSVRQIIEVLSEGRTVTYKITIPEGLTSHQIVERLKADPNLSGDIAAVPAEGTLLPETFIVPRGSSRQAVIDAMAAEARKLPDKLWAQRKADLPIKSWEEAVILASIVEKETGRNDERERVAAVFVNRLRQNMRLQSDPTIVYGIYGGKAVWNKPILRSEIAQKNSHNTYQIDGLPPTPICNPGKAAIEAVLNPADTKELYFVATGNGGHAFADNLKDHNANVLKWRATEKEMRAKAAAGTPGSAVAVPAAPQQQPSAAEPPLPSGPPTRAVIRRPPKVQQGEAAPPDKAKEAAPAAAPAPKAATAKEAPTPAKPAAKTAPQQEVLPWAKPAR